MWMSTLSIKENSVPFYLQKEKECEFLDKYAAGGSCSAVKGRKPRDINAKRLLSKRNFEEILFSANDTPRDRKRKEIVGQTMEDMI